MTESLQYIVLESGIHQLIWLNNSQDAVDEYIQLLRKIDSNIQRLSENETVTVRVLHDFRLTKPPPLQAMVAQTIDFRQWFLFSSEIMSRFAYLSDLPNIAEIIGQVSILLPKNRKRQFFKSDEEQKAIEWLLSDE